MKKRFAVVALATAALLATTVAATAKPAGERAGGVLKVVAWEGYTENQWVKPFEKQSGCKIQHQYAGSSDEMYNLMKKNAGYDLWLSPVSGERCTIAGPWRRSPPARRWVAPRAPSST